MKKLMVSLIALSVLSFVGQAVQAGPLGDALNNAAKSVNQKEQEAANAQKARQEAREKQQKEWQQKREQARKDAQKRQEARQKEIQKKKDAWNTLMGD